MTPIFQGMYAFYKANSGDAFYISTGGRWYFQTAPEDAAKPYVTAWDIGTGGNDPWFTHEFVCQRIQLSIYNHRNDENLILMGEQCKTLFTKAKAEITVAGWSLISFDSQNQYQPGVLYDAFTKDWQYPLIYEARLQRAR